MANDSGDRCPFLKDTGDILTVKERGKEIL